RQLPSAAPTETAIHLNTFFFQAEDGIRDLIVTGVQTCALPICARRRQEVDGRGASRHVGVALGVHGDAIALVVVAAAEIGGVEEGGPCRVELRDEGGGDATKGRLDRALRRREVGGTGGTGHVGVPCRVYSDAEALI